MTLPFFRCLSITLIALTCTLTVAHAQDADGYAGTARVVHPGVTFTLVNTPRPLSLREDAVQGLTAGDVLTTDRTGRVLITFGDWLEILLLPSSTLTMLENRALGGGRYAVRVGLDGHTVQSWLPASAAQASLEIETDLARVRAESGLLAVWSQLEGSAVVTVAEGAAEVTTVVGTLPLRAGDGLFADTVTARVEPFAEPPYNGARAFGLLRGCDARVSVGGERLNIRAGTSVGYAVIGDLVDGARIRLLAITEDGLWYRIQRFSGFGWVLTSGVRADCPALPLYPNNYGEANLELFNYEPVEVALLTPFYGKPEDNLWLWRWPEA